MKKICIIASTPITFNAFLKEHINSLLLSHEVTVVSSNVDNLQINEHAVRKQIELNREISVFKDLWSLVILFLFLKKSSFDLVITITPKAGLLGMLASYFALVPNRVHFFTGQVWANKGGFFRFSLKLIDRLIANLSTSPLVDSLSQLSFLKENKILDGKGQVIGAGSISGVDVDRFTFSVEHRQAFRQFLDISDDTILIVFLGRLNRDKGVFDLFQAHCALCIDFDTSLLLIGPDECNFRSHIEDSPHLLKSCHIIGSVDNPEAWLSAGDIFCLPSYREGFGTSVIEANSIGLPVVASRIYGLTDAVVENYSGLLHAKGDVGDLSDKLRVLLRSSKLRKIMGDNARSRVRNEFTSEIVTNLFTNFVNDLLDVKRK